MTYQQRPAYSFDRMYRIVARDTEGPYDVLDPNHMAWWVPSLGPSASLLLPILVHSDGRTVTSDDLAFQLGIMESKLSQTLHRCCKYGQCGIRPDGPGIEVLTVPRRLGHITASQMRRFPEWFQQGVREFERAQFIAKNGAGLEVAV